MNKINHYFLFGDIHGNVNPVVDWVENNLTTPKEETALILLGDVGLNYYMDTSDRARKKKLNNCGVRIYCLRGNHEMRVSDAARLCNYTQKWDEDTQNYVWTEPAYPNLYFLLDEGGIYQFAGNRTLVIPGAYSVDKYYRLQVGYMWFANEQLNFEEMEQLKDIAIDGSPFDYILAHSCPLSWEPYFRDLFLSGIDQSKVDKTTELFLDEIIENVKYKHFYFGHFHDDRNIPNQNATMLYHRVIKLGEELTNE